MTNEWTNATTGETRTTAQLVDDYDRGLAGPVADFIAAELIPDACAEAVLERLGDLSASRDIAQRKTLHLARLIVAAMARKR